MKLTLIQMASNGTRKENEEKTFKFLKDAVLDKPDIICLSELFLSWGSDFDNIKVEKEDIKVYQNFAKENNVNLVLGSVAFKNELSNKTTNTCFIIDRFGNIVLRYDKQYMYEVNKKDFKFNESDETIPGNELGITNLDGVTIGVGICFDLRFPEYFRDLIKRGVQIIFLPSHFRESTGKTAWDILTKARAIENQVYFCACNQTGNDLCGNSKVIDYKGNIIKQLDKEEEILTVSIDLEKQNEYRKELPVLKQIKE